MGDLIERLQRLSSGDEVSDRTYRSEIEAEAANEIERLNAIIKLGRRPGKSNLPYIKEIERLEAKIRNVEILVNRAAHDRTYDGDLIDDIRDALDSKEK